MRKGALSEAEEVLAAAHSVEGATALAEAHLAEEAAVLAAVHLAEGALTAAADRSGVREDHSRAQRAAPAHSADPTPAVRLAGREHSAARGA